MKSIRSIVGAVAFGSLMAPAAVADTLDWSSLQGTLDKPGYDRSSAIYQATSADGTDITFRLRHLDTSSGKFSYSKWEINRWGDPTGFYTPPGSWQVPSNTANDVGLGLWGYWGENETPLTLGQSTTYILEILFENPVSDVTIPVHGINALINASGSNAREIATFKAFLADKDRTPGITFENAGDSLFFGGNTLAGDPNVQAGSQSGFYPVTDDSSALLTIDSPIDRLEMQIETEAITDTAGNFSDAVQNWSCTLGNLSFTNEDPLDRAVLAWSPLKGTLQKPDYNTDGDSFFTFASDDLGISFDLNYVVTTNDKFSYSKWEIDGWGDPNGVFAPLGSWQVNTNSFNDVVLAPWGYWGNDGSPTSQVTELGDVNVYSMSILFAEPVADLSFALNGIDAALSADFNTVDRMDVRAFLDGQARANPISVGQLGRLPVVDGTILGVFPSALQDSIEPLSEAGTAVIKFPEVIDQVDLTFTTTADTPFPASFNDGTQQWGFSMGDLSFVRSDPPSTSTDTSIAWAPLRTTLQQEPFTTDPGSYEVDSVDGNVTATFDISHLGTTDDKFSYWKWEIDRWGDPTGLSTPLPGAWQVVTNEANDIVFGVWGYWGNDGSAGQPPVEVGDSTSYKLAISFDQPVDNLKFDLNGVNGFIKSVDGFNSRDLLTIQTSLDGDEQGSAVYSNEGDAFTRSGNVLTGDYTNQIVGVFGGQHVSDQGSLTIQLTETVDQVELILVNEAGHFDLQQFQDGLQTFSFSVSDLSFSYEP